MAIRRPKPITPTPGELLIFDPSEWAAPDESDWRPGFQKWKTARRAWLAEHPDGSDLGDMVSVFRDEHQALMEMLEEDPPPPQDAVSIRPPIVKPVPKKGA
jgi:hypothetical protein